MKKNVLLSSIVTIALCLCLIAGSTFALFTSESVLDVEVTSGKVEISADITNLQLWSVVGDANGDVVDEYGNTYFYQNQTELGKDSFLNTGKADFATNVLSLERVTPGDKVSFNLQGTNTSDVNILVRYVVRYLPDAALEAQSETPLYYGVNIKVAGQEYAGVTYYASTWEPVAVGANMTAALVEIGLPVNAQNEYQHGAANYSITVEAIQGNAVVDAGPTIQVANSSSAITGSLTNGAGIEINEDIDETLTFDSNTNGTLDLKDNSLNNNVINDGGNVVISGGEINVDNYGNADNSNSCGFQNNGGDAILNDVIMNAGDADDYANINHGGYVEYNNVHIDANGGAVAITGGKAVFNSGSVGISGTTTNPRYNFYLEGGELIINGGDFSFEAKTLKRAYMYIGAGATVTINGGNFGEASTRSGYTEGFRVAAGGSLTITGGTFGFDPSAWVAAGYVAVENGGVWTVSIQ